MQEPFDENPTEILFDGESLLRRMMGDRQLARSVIGGFLERAPSQLTALRTRLMEADAVGARLQAHQLKGAAATVAAGGLSAIALAIERECAAGQLNRCFGLLPRAAGELERFKKTLAQTGWA